GAAAVRTRSRLWNNLGARGFQLTARAVRAGQTKPVFRVFLRYFPELTCYNELPALLRLIMRYLKSLIVSSSLLLFCVASAAAQNSTVAVAPMQMRGLMP